MSLSADKIEKYKWFRKQLSNGRIPDDPEYSPGIDYASFIIETLQAQVNGLVGALERLKNNSEITEDNSFVQLSTGQTWITNNPEGLEANSDYKRNWTMWVSLHDKEELDALFAPLSTLPQSHLDTYRKKEAVIEAAVKYIEATGLSIGLEEDAFETLHQAVEAIKEMESA